MRILCLPLLLLLTACASRQPVIVPAPAESPSPYGVMRAPASHLDDSVLWGGMVLEVRNYERYSEVEILSFPLDRGQRPLPTARDQGRFIALLAGFADPAELPQGRFVTLLGRITGDREGTLHRAPYVWPEVDVRTLHVWPEDFRERRSRVTIGIGIGIRG
ncbi:MAG TPA: Slp family lipoprotein [Xanthomonadaceae bacterium]|nr:Slp family lipoprotein [Xanthomonadaceae bacterium]